MISINVNCASCCRNLAIKDATLSRKDLTIFIERCMCQDDNLLAEGYVKKEREIIDLNGGGDASNHIS